MTKSGDFGDTIESGNPCDTYEFGNKHGADEGRLQRQKRNYVRKIPKQ